MKQSIKKIKKLIIKLTQAFSKEQIVSFLRDAPNDASYMQMKVVSIIAINGLLRLNELVSFDWNNISLVSVDDGD